VLPEPRLRVDRDPGVNDSPGALDHVHPVRFSQCPCRLLRRDRAQGKKKARAGTRAIFPSKLEGANLPRPHLPFANSSMKPASVSTHP
jgi:hypothetical protein